MPSKTFWRILLGIAILFFVLWHPVDECRVHAAGDTTWQEDYDYYLEDYSQDGPFIHIHEYIGTGSSSTVYSTATISGITYKTHFAETIPEHPVDGGKLEK